MNETMPAYFKDFKDELKTSLNKITERIDKIDVKVNKMDVKVNKIDGIIEKLDMVIKKQDVHFEAIGELKVQVTGIELSLKDKASHEYVKEIEKRTEKLEEAVFA